MLQICLGVQWWIITKFCSLKFGTETQNYWKLLNILANITGNILWMHFRIFCFSLSLKLHFENLIFIIEWPNKLYSICYYVYFNYLIIAYFFSTICTLSMAVWTIGSRQQSQETSRLILNVVTALETLCRWYSPIRSLPDFGGWVGCPILKKMKIIKNLNEASELWKE